MQLRIKCDAKVNLNNFVNLKEIECSVENYLLENDTLEGMIKVNGSYIKDDLESVYLYEENVPFTVVFSNNNMEIDKIEIEDFKYNEVINQGVECGFDILIDYHEKVETEEVLVETENDFLAEQDDEELKNEINQKYDELLNEIIEGRNDNFLEEDEVKEEIDISTSEESNVYISENSDNNKVNFSKIKEKYSSYRVYYPKKESEVEKICTIEKVSLDKIYKDKANKDFQNKMRIIIK